jgi:tRNA(Ser,Leu) C12 N-acetylase TAN1
MEWNAVAIPATQCFGLAWRFLDAFGTVKRSNYLNVLVVQTADPPREFLDAVEREMVANPDARDLVARLAPAEHTFGFQDVVDFDLRAREVAMKRVTELDGKSFYVRIHRRGFKKDFDRLVRERKLGEALLDDTIARGSRARISYDDPDVVVAIETVDQRAGLSFWTRADLQKYPLVRPA